MAHSMSWQILRVGHSATWLKSFIVFRLAIIELKTSTYNKCPSTYFRYFEGLFRIDFAFLNPIENGRLYVCGIFDGLHQ